ncbi:MAG: universal stress protein [Flavisolibacter sp.]|nr:universal stress protein [Flavisolibacter sp.]
MKTILVALDYEPSAQKIADTGLTFAKSMKAEMILLHVVPESSYYSSLKYSPILGFETLSAINVVETENELELTKTAEDFLETIRRNLGDESITILVKTGDLGENVLEVAKNRKADMIVIGTHHKRGIEKILSGSVAEKVFHHSPVPLLIIPVES